MKKRITFICILFAISLLYGCSAAVEETKGKAETNQSEDAKEVQRFKKLQEESDKLIKAIQDLSPSAVKEQKALKLIKKYIKAKTNVKEDSWPHYPVLRKLMNEL